MKDFSEMIEMDLDGEPYLVDVDFKVTMVDNSGPEPISFDVEISEIEFYHIAYLGPQEAVRLIEDEKLNLRLLALFLETNQYDRAMQNFVDNYGWDYTSR